MYGLIWIQIKEKMGKNVYNNQRNMNTNLIFYYIKDLLILFRCENYTYF